MEVDTLGDALALWIPVVQNKMLRTRWELFEKNLRSPYFKERQIYDFLFSEDTNGNQTFCAAGLAIETWRIRTKRVSIPVADPMFALNKLPPEILKWYGFPKEPPEIFYEKKWYTLEKLNDEILVPDLRTGELAPISFREIAVHIKATRRLAIARSKTNLEGTSND
jgi:hypothetical protein